MEAHQHRRDNEPKPSYHRRSVDTDKVARYGMSIERWFKLFWPVITLLWGVFMATVWQPLRSIPALHDEVSKLAEQAKRAAEIDSVSLIERADLRKGQAITFKILCFNLDYNDRIKYDINCGNIPLPKR